MPYKKKETAKGFKTSTAKSAKSYEESAMKVRDIGSYKKGGKMKMGSYKDGGIIQHD